MAFYSNHRLWCVSLLLILLFCDGHSDTIKCKSSSGDDTDWFIVYKLPRVKDSPNSNIANGLGFASLFPDRTDWVLSRDKSINDSDSLVGLTLRPLFEALNITRRHESDLAYILYNDQPPWGPTADSGGHTKGIILTDSTQGLWLQHSVPKYPSLTSGEYSYPRTGQMNGQILHCLSLSLEDIDQIGDLLLVTKPHLYNYSLPQSLRGRLPNLSKLVDLADLQQHNNRTRGPSAPSINNKLVQIHDGKRLVFSFAKGPSFNKEIYSDWIAPKFNAELDVQSWLNGPHPYPSNCTSSLKVFNIEDQELLGTKWTTHTDHAKWAIATNQPLVCIGDLNRMEHQSKRGGSVNCFMDKGIWRSFKKGVVSTMPCPRPNLTSPNPNILNRFLRFLRNLYL